MESLDINGVNVLFPYKPYDIQLDYMRSVISCLQQKCNGLLESPTGTGKTLSLLCSSLGWLEAQDIKHLQKCLHERQDPNKDSVDSKSLSLNGWQLNQSLPKILYSSRTHSQLSQACNELKRTYYKRFTSVVIGSRDQLCLNESVSRLESISAKNQSCRHKIASNSCPYYRNYEQKVNRETDFTDNQVFDIEDLVKLGKKHTCCPYYASRYIKSKASVVFSPYNYILDPTIRRTQSLDLRNAVIIFDEGHNIEKMCEESVSTELKSETLAVCIKHINTILEKLKQIDDGSYEGFDEDLFKELQLESVAKLKMIICDLEMAFDQFIKSSPTVKTTHRTELIFDLMERIGLGFENCGFVLEVIDKIAVALISSKTLNSSASFVLSTAFTTLAEFIERLIPISLLTTESYENHKNEFIKKFKIFSETGIDSEENDNKTNFWNKKASPNAWILHIWCLSASIGTKALLELGVHSIIITSGTLAPLNSFETEMGIEFAIKLQNAHVIKENQLSIMNIGKSSDGEVLTSKYDNKDNMSYYRALGNTLIDLFKIVPKGVLIFFSSYTSLNKSIQVWKSNDKWLVWDTLNSIKQIYLEPRSKQAFADCILKYKSKIDEPNSSGAAFLGVCRGKLSEGMDLTNDYCRAVIMTGLPFPSIADPRVILKKQYLNELKSKQLSADGWYSLQMKRALNQAIGRVVRHKDDFGAILLCDSRFGLLNDGLSKWVEKFIVKGNTDYKAKLTRLQRFYSQHNVQCNQMCVSSQQCVSTFSQNKSKDLKLIPNIQSTSSSKLRNSSSVDGLTDEITIINEFKCLQNKTTRNSFVKTKSIFDTLSSNVSEKSFDTKRTFNDFKNSKSEQEIIQIDFSPNKRKKLNVPLKSILGSTSAQLMDPIVERVDTQLQGIIKNKSFNDSNSSKKVRWSEETTIQTIEDQIITTQLSEPTQPSEPNNETNVESNLKSNDQLLNVWRKNESELKELFNNTKKFQRLCETIRKFKQFKNVIYLAASFNSIFIKVDKEKRDKFIRELSVIVPNGERPNFLRNCDVKPLYNELEPIKQFKVLKRKDKCESPLTQNI